MRLTYQPAENSLRLTRDQETDVARHHVTLDGYVDMGVGGRIVGVEALSPPNLDLSVALEPWLSDGTASNYVSLEGDSAYIELSVPEETDAHEQIRAVPATFSAEVDDAGRLLALSIPRHGSGYEISYPSGNQ